jgi:hypothetical protein
MEKISDKLEISKVLNSSISFQVFIAGYSFDLSNVSYQDFPQDLIYAICTRTYLQFIYDFNFDQKGVLFYLANEFSMQSKMMNKEMIIPLLKDFSYYYISRYENEKVNQKDCIRILGKVVSGTYHSNYYFEDKKIPYIDLQQFYLCVSHITIAHNHESLISPLPVLFFGSNDLKEWKRITIENEVSKIIDDSDIDAVKVARTWRLQSRDYFRYFKLPNRIRSMNSDQFYYSTSLSGIEMYGNLI